MKVIYEGVINQDEGQKTIRSDFVCRVPQLYGCPSDLVYTYSRVEAIF